MTFKEKLAKEHPDKINPYCDGGCIGCPRSYGYEEISYCGGSLLGEGNAKCTECWDREMPTEPQEDMDKEDYRNLGYNEGLQDAWELALKYIKMGVAERKKIFHIHDCESFFGIFEPQEALAKLEDYEKEKEIKVGDVVKCREENIVVIRICGKDYYGLSADGVLFICSKSVLSKTSKHIDIESLLGQIRGE